MASLKLGAAGTALIILKSEDYSAWYEQQSVRTKHWLTSTGYKGEGLSLVPSDQGGIELALYCVNDPDSFFVCGDLVTMLPAGDYFLNADYKLCKTAAFSWGIGSYKFDRYKKKSQEQEPQPCLVLCSPTAYEHADQLIKAVSLVRDLVNTPACDMMPEHLCGAVAALADQYNAQMKTCVGDDLLQQGYPAIHAVGRASVHAPQLIDMRWGDVQHAKVTLVGKGVCFDSGGLNLKPAEGIRLMKKDMGGAANAIGLARLIMAYRLPVRLRLLIPAVENAVAGNAFRPGDVIKTRKGLTVEIDNTDAEGRLVLCDALAEADSESPDLLLDFATLTGAGKIALGTEIPALFSNDKNIASMLIECAEAVNDPVWPLPLYKPYFDMLKSDVADVVNAAPSRFAGAITAALYLQKFVDDKTCWVHFDLMAWNTRKLPGRPVGGEAQTIRAVFNYLQQRYST